MTKPAGDWPAFGIGYITIILIGMDMSIALEENNKKSYIPPDSGGQGLPPSGGLVPPSEEWLNIRRNCRNCQIPARTRTGHPIPAVRRADRPIPQNRHRHTRNPQSDRHSNRTYQTALDPTQNPHGCPSIL